MIVEGAIAVKAVINSEKRLVRKVYIRKDKKTKDFNYIRKLCRNKNIVLEELESVMLEEYTKGKSHGGICAEVENRKYDEFTEGDIFFLDGIEDPFNLGYAMRTLYALGVKNVLLSQIDYDVIN